MISIKQTKERNNDLQDYFYYNIIYLFSLRLINKSNVSTFPMSLQNYFTRRTLLSKSVTGNSKIHNELQNWPVKIKSWYSRVNNRDVDRRLFGYWRIASDRNNIPLQLRSVSVVLVSVSCYNKMYFFTDIRGTSLVILLSRYYLAIQFMNLHAIRQENNLLTCLQSLFHFRVAESA